MLLGTTIVASTLSLGSRKVMIMRAFPTFAATLACQIETAWRLVGSPSSPRLSRWALSVAVVVGLPILFTLLISLLGPFASFLPILTPVTLSGVHTSNLRLSC